MKSKDNRKLSALKGQPFKVIGAVTTGNSSGTMYYCKPSVPCKLLGAKLRIVTAAGANLSGAGTFTKETAVTDPDLKYDEIKISTSISAGTAVSSDDLMGVAVAAVASAPSVYNCIPGANYAASVNSFDPKNGDALVITLPATNNATLMAATLELEFLPI